MRAIRAVWIAAAVGLLAASPGCNCNDDSSIGDPCTDEDDCNGDTMCVDGRCVVVCPDCPDTGVEPGCIDRDGDGRGEGCRRGPDCDDNDYRQIGTESCEDGADNDCDGNVDESNGACACAVGCTGSPVGPGTGNPFMPGPGTSDGVGLDDDGNLVLDSREISHHMIWIADTLNGSVMKVDTQTFQELARYRTGPAAPVTSFFTGNDPSRSSVNSLNDVYVGNRQNSSGTPGSGSVTKISSLGSECPDTNEDGMRMTSMSVSDVLPWGQDDCVLWQTEFPDNQTDKIRSVAAQDVLGPDLEIIPFVWVGDWHDSGTSWVYKLDGATGEVLFRTESPVRPYGFALDGAGNLWIAGRDSAALGRIDTNRCIDEASCDVEVCDETGDDCIKQAIPAGRSALYGITVDFKQRVWIGLAFGAEGVLRYDPSAAMDDRWTFIDTVQVNGIAADARGYVYGAGKQSNSIIRIDADDPTNFLEIDTANDPKGMAVDAEGKIWAINQDGGNVTVLTPGADIDQNTLREDVAPDLVGPYTYSDMTGIQLRLATNPRGYYRHVFDGCPEGADTIWDSLWWDAEVPTGTQLVWRVRTADTREALAAAAWTLVAQVPPDSSPVDVAAKLQEADIEPMQFLELEVALVANRSSTEEVISPVVRGFDVGRFCPGILQ